MKNIVSLVVVILVSALFVGCDEGTQGPGMEVDSGGGGKVDAVVMGDVGKGDGGDVSGEGVGSCTIFYNKDGYADPCVTAGTGYCQSWDITETILNQRVLDPSNTTGKLVGVCTEKCVLPDDNRQFSLGEECGQPGLVCKMIRNHSNVKHPICMGS